MIYLIGNFPYFVKYFEKFINGIPEYLGLFGPSYVFIAKEKSSDSSGSLRYSLFKRYEIFDLE